MTPKAITRDWREGGRELGGGEEEREVRGREESGREEEEEWEAREIEEEEEKEERWEG